jgi:preprotein translocase subunit YajC
MFFVTPAYAQAAGAGGAASMLSSFGLFIPIFFIFYFLIIRPQQKKLKEQKAMVEALRRGDQVLTQGGILGKVVKVGDDGNLDVEIAEGVKVKMPRAAIVQVISKTEPAAG